MPEVNIIVQNADGSPLMPTHHYGRVKRMLKAGKARIVSVKPFVIRLTYTIIKPGLDNVTLGIDPGRTNIGLSLIDSKGRNLGSYLVETDNCDIPHNMNNKKKHRQASRRGERKCRQRRAVAHDETIAVTEIYRILPGCKKTIKCKGIKNSEARFNNRKRPEGWLTPTARHLLNTHLRIVEIMSRYYPIANVAIEINRFDFAKMENPGWRIPVSATGNTRKVDCLVSKTAMTPSFMIRMANVCFVGSVPLSTIITLCPEDVDLKAWII